MSLGPINITRKTGKERFYSSSREVDIQLLDFWQWSTSDVLSNSTRGRLAEFIVATALGVANKVRDEWDSYDLTTKDGIKVEIKTSAYLQSWHQDKLSSISFDIKPTIGWDGSTNRFEGERKRQSDVYVFCMLHHKDKKTVDPLDLDQWTFYISPTVVLDQNLGDQKRITLGRLLKLEPIECGYWGIKESLIDSLK